MSAQRDMDLRTQVLKGVVQAVNDSGQEQVLTVALDDLGPREIPFAQPYGEAGTPPADGMLAYVVAIGGDPAHLAVIALTNPSYRFGQTSTGDKVVYDWNGQRLHFRDGTIVEIHAGASLVVTAPQVTFQAPAGDVDITIAGTLTVTKDIYDQAGAHGSIGTLRGDYNAHTHPSPGTSGPDPTTP